MGITWFHTGINMESFWLSGLFLRAVLTGSLLALACGLLGVFLVLRRDAMIGHGLSHIAFAGVAVGLVLNLLPVLVSIAICVTGSLFILKLKDRARLPGDTAIGLLSSGGMALAVLLSALRKNFGAELAGYLFGDLLALSPAEVYLAGAVVFLVLVLIVVFYPQLLLMTLDRESAVVAGIKVRRLDRLLVMLTAVTTVLGLKIVGLLLITGLTVIPAASALQIARSFRSSLILSSLFSLISVLSGIMLAYLLNLPASAAIISMALLLFGVSLVWRKLR